MWFNVLYKGPAIVHFSLVITSISIFYMTYVYYTNNQIVPLHAVIAENQTSSFVWCIIEFRTRNLLGLLLYYEKRHNIAWLNDIHIYLLIFTQNIKLSRWQLYLHVGHHHLWHQNVVMLTVDYAVLDDIRTITEKIFLFILSSFFFFALFRLPAQTTHCNDVRAYSVLPRIPVAMNF